MEVVTELSTEKPRDVNVLASLDTIFPTATSIGPTVAD